MTFFSEELLGILKGKIPLDKNRAKEIVENDGLFFENDSVIKQYKFTEEETKHTAALLQSISLDYIVELRSLTKYGSGKPVFRDKSRVARLCYLHHRLLTLIKSVTMDPVKIELRGSDNE